MPVLVAGIHVFCYPIVSETWMAGSSPAMAKEKLIKYAQTACESAVSGFDAGACGDYVMRS
jgi:hypothetical protein